MGKILIVDDEKEVTEFLKNFLIRRRKNIKVFCANNVEEAVEIFTKEKPELVFLDIKMDMPEDGFILLEKIRKIANEEETKVVMLTGREERSAMVKSKKLGAQDYLIKPIDLVEFDRLVSYYLEKK